MYIPYRRYVCVKSHGSIAPKIAILGMRMGHGGNSPDVEPMPRTRSRKKASHVLESQNDV